MLRFVFVAVLLPCIISIPQSLVAKEQTISDQQTNLMEVAASSGSNNPPLVRQPGQAISTPFERFGQTTVVADGRLYSFGGMERGGAMPSNDLLVFDILGKHWSTIPVFGEKPPGRFFHSASVSSNGKDMYITGGTPCFSRIYMKSLEFFDSNGPYVTQRQHSVTEALSIEHSQGLDDVYSFNFASRVWKQLKAATDTHALRCEAASNVFYRNSETMVRPMAVSVLATVTAVAYAML